MSREIRRVPTNFNWPLGLTWQGYEMPDELILPCCSSCQGDGWNPVAIPLVRHYYPEDISDHYGFGPEQAQLLAWCDKLTDEEVSYLFRENFLPQWETQPSAAEYNQDIRENDGRLDDMIRFTVVRLRCEAAGIPSLCPACEGSGHGGTAQQKAAQEAWEPTDPPTGQGWQVWETVSNGSPISPVFASAEQLAAWIADPSRDSESQGWLQVQPYEQALAFVHEGWAPSAVLVDGKFSTGQEWAGKQ